MIWSDGFADLTPSNSKNHKKRFKVVAVVVDLAYNDATYTKKKMRV